jgi:hypothetical protein
MIYYVLSQLSRLSRSCFSSHDAEEVVAHGLDNLVFKLKDG